MTLFSQMMPAAAKILFVIAVLVFVLMMVGALAAVLLDRDEKLNLVVSLTYGISSGLQAAFWPFFGAAIVWRLDRWLDSERLPA